jgi:hypothetical protein
MVTEPRPIVKTRLMMYLIFAAPVVFAVIPDPSIELVPMELLPFWSKPFLPRKVISSPLLKHGSAF